jgi:uncharacterized membrane protein
VPVVRKIDPSEVEVLDRSGESLSHKEMPSGGFFRGGVRVIQGGPWMLLLVPILIPLVLVGLFLLLVPLLIFGRRIPWPKR